MKKLCRSCLPKAPKRSKSSIVNHPLVPRATDTLIGPKVIIVGAGAAGLACAVKLLEYGIKDVIILEAEKRIGGRIHTVPFSENVIDLGAQWVHGEKNNVVYEMVNNFNLLETTGDIYMVFDCIRSNGELVPDAIVQQMKDLLAEIFFDRRSEMSEYDGSFGDFLKICFFNALRDPSFETIDRKIAMEFFENFKKMESSESSLGLDEVSARGFAEYWECDGDYMLNFKEKGYEQFIRILTGAKPNSESLNGILGPKIIFDAKVTQINWNRDDGLIEVIVKDMEDSYLADNVVITVSLGVLKRHANTLFKPSLPEEKMQAIDGLGFGNVLKVFLEFPYRFWKPKWTGFTTLWREEDIEELQERGEEWLQEIYGFYTVVYQPRLLQAWAVGPEVQRMEKMPRSELQNHIMGILRRFLKNMYTIPNPTKIRVSSWSTNDNFLGGYSFRTMKTEEVGTSANSLAQPLSTMMMVPMSEKSTISDDGENTETETARYTIKPALLFAGEATSTHYFSTVHGAVESGWREAKRLAGYYDCEI